MVLVTSRMSLVSAAAKRSPRKGGHAQQHSFFRRYGVNLPSSFTRGHSYTLVYSTCLPVAVCGTGSVCPSAARISCPFRCLVIGWCPKTPAFHSPLAF